MSRKRRIFKSKDIIALVTLVGGFILLALGIDSIVGGMLMMVVGWYFGSKD